MDLEPGTVVANHYKVSRQLGRGGMGEVYAAENIRTGRFVAVKVLRADSKTKSSAVARFRREARAAGSISSDYVTQVLDVEEDDKLGIVLVFELLQGESLIERLKRTGPIPFDELHPIIEQVWMGLADAHRAGIIHRDLKPSNVFLEKRPDGTVRVKILDFGISKLPKEMGGETLTELGQSLGTFSFMPPEQIGKAKTVDHRADIYACVTLIYQAMSGQLPYPARNILVMVEMKTKNDPRSLADAMGAPVDPPLEDFVKKGLARDPAQRFQTAMEALFAWRKLGPSQNARTMPFPQQSYEEPNAGPPSWRGNGPTTRNDGPEDSASTLNMPPKQVQMLEGLNVPDRPSPNASGEAVTLRPVNSDAPTAFFEAAKGTSVAHPGGARMPNAPVGITRNEQQVELGQAPGLRAPLPVTPATADETSVPSHDATRVYRPTSPQANGRAPVNEEPSEALELRAPAKPKRIETVLFVVGVLVLGIIGFGLAAAAFHFMGR